MISANARAASRIRLTTWDEDKVVETARELKAKTGGASLAFVFATRAFRQHWRDLIEIIQVEGHARHVAGSSAGGLIGTGQEDETVEGFSVLFLHAPQAKVQSWVINEDFQLPQEVTGGGWILLGNPLRLNAQMLLEDMTRAWPGVPVYGGMAGGPWDGDGLFLLHHEHDVTDAAGLLVHVSGLRMTGLVSQGCQPIGEPYTITRVDDDVLLGVGGRRAYDVLVETFEALPEADRDLARGNIMAGLAASEYREEFQRGDFLVRNIIGGDPLSGGIKIGALPRVGQTMQFQLRERDAADEDLRSRCAAALQSHGRPLACLLFSCSGRGQHLFGVPNHDAGIVAETFGPVPTAGFFAAGEIGPVAGVNFIHGYTASAALFYGS